MANCLEPDKNYLMYSVQNKIENIYTNIYSSQKLFKIMKENASSQKLTKIMNENALHLNRTEHRNI